MSYDPTTYRMMSQEEHILSRPDMYISSIEQSARFERIYNSENHRFDYRIISIPPGLERLYLEILSNAGDNVQRSRNIGIDPCVIVINMNENEISIMNYGIPIPIDIHPTHQILVPEMIFGYLLSSGNYDGDRIGAGLNGLGAKLTNVFSSFFKVEVIDRSRNLMYEQTWEKNMSTKGEAKISVIDSSVNIGDQPGMVRVTYTIDFHRFGYTKYPDEAFYLFMRHAIDTSVTCKIPLIFNGVLFDMRDFKLYIDMLYPDKNRFFHYEWPPGTTITTMKEGTQLSADLRICPTVEMCVIDTPDEGIFISFVNGLLTQDGGSHVDSAYKVIGSTILDSLNREKKLLNISDVKNHLTIVILCKILNPTYSSQSKTKLVKPSNIKITVSDKLVKQIEKWDFMKRLYFALEAKQFKQLQKTDGKRQRFVDVAKLEDANNAGDPDYGRFCALYIVEGGSAKGFATTMVSILNGRDYMGILPIQGKVLNVRNASAIQMSKNKEITILKESLGLREGIDYTSDENYLQLRYGKIVICADSDTDGKHIVGLLLNLFQCNYCSLLKRGFVCFLRTPIIRVQKGKLMLRFYTRGQYEKWKSSTPTWRSWETQYYKGLGTFEDPDIKIELQEPKITDCVYDTDTDETLSLAFDEKRSSDRKTWIATWNEDKQEVECPPSEPISRFLNTEMIEHSVENVRRSIPGLDGLKEVQRKILFIMMKNYREKIKVAQLAGGVSLESAYHHGEQCLGEAIVYMAQAFVGTNNMPLLEDLGQFGSRVDGRSKHSQIRYLYTKLSWAVKYLFNDDDIPLYNHVFDEGKKHEPIVLYPILPIHFINGSLGIGTGHSTFIPSFNPIHVYEWYRRKIVGEELPELCPWYRGYNGMISLNVREIKDKSHISFRTTGSYELSGGTVIVKELPLFTWSIEYKLWLTSLVTDKKITRYKNYCTKEKAIFEITGFHDPDIKSLKLARSFTMTNMTILDEKKSPITYKSLNEGLEHFYTWRIGIYELRKKNQLRIMGEKIEEIKKKIAFILDMLSGKLIVVNRSRKDVHADMIRLGHNIELLKISISALTADDVLELQKSLEKKESEVKELEGKKPGDIWLEDLSRFIKEYIKKYKDY